MVKAGHVSVGKEGPRLMSTRCMHDLVKQDNTPFSCPSLAVQMSLLFFWSVPHTLLSRFVLSTHDFWPEALHLTCCFCPGGAHQ